MQLETEAVILTHELNCIKIFWYSSFTERNKTKTKHAQDHNIRVFAQGIDTKRFRLHNIAIEA